MGSSPNPNFDFVMLVGQDYVLNTNQLPTFLLQISLGLIYSVYLFVLPAYLVPYWSYCNGQSEWSKKVLYGKLPTNTIQLPAFSHDVKPRFRSILVCEVGSDHIILYATPCPLGFGIRDTFYSHNLSVFH